MSKPYTLGEVLTTLDEMNPQERTPTCEALESEEVEELQKQIRQAYNLLLEVNCFLTPEGLLQRVSAARELIHEVLQNL